VRPLHTQRTTATAAAAAAAGSSVSSHIIYSCTAQQITLRVAAHAWLLCTGPAAGCCSTRVSPVPGSPASRWEGHQQGCW
jgi:hypothetical protein